jgi:oxygen-independent coproporphyrinogen-3 oxidase
MNLPPLSLYVHIPWCVQKCPYCDFNSHGLKSDIPESTYVQHLLDDLKSDLQYVQGRNLHSIFIGGGTPSLFSEHGIATLLAGIEALIPFKDGIEITLEANPGTVEAERFKGYQKAGVNRISIGVQSLQQDKLKSLGRIHNADEAINAALLAKSIGLNSFNMDLMHGLPDQSIDDALSDLKQVIALNPPHISWYQLTIEPNTQFASKPPVLPEDDTLWEIQEQGHQLLSAAGYQQYEISGYAKPGYQCQHNLNYWRFGDYLGIGCGAHGKITGLKANEIKRTVKVKHPKGYMDLTRPYLFDQWQVDANELPFEYFMNRLRLHEAFDISDYAHFTGQPIKRIMQQVNQAQEKGLMQQKGNIWQVTAKGHRFLNDLLQLFV